MKHQNYKIGLYIRVSTEEQAENPEGSIKNQEERLIQTIKFKNMEGNFGEVVHVYIDRAKSGKDTNRPELQKMLIAIKTKKINLIMVSELSRISRNMKDFSEIWDMMKKMDCGFYSLRENFDTTTAAGEMVLYTLANLAQFERRQVSERVTANLNARAARGLYNGGSVPVGYQLIPDKPGFLEVDEKSAVLIRTIFEAFIANGTLSSTARWLNSKNFKLPKKIQGGGRHMRSDAFTVDNVHHILRNKFYLGIRAFKQGKEIKEVQAVWPAIIESELFERVNTLLTENLSAKKPMTEIRYPYILTGLVRCACCKNPMVGKSAHGRKEKIGYYEHGWLTKRNSTLSQKLLTCDPHRVLAKKLEPLVLEKVTLLLESEHLAKELIREATESFEKNSPKKEYDRLKASIYGYNSQLEAMAERLSELPKTVSPKHIYQQMEKIEKLKLETEEKLREIKDSQGVIEKPVQLTDYREFLKTIKSLFGQNQNYELQAQIIKRLVSMIEVGKDFVRIHYFIGEQIVHTDMESLISIKTGEIDNKMPSEFSDSEAAFQEQKNLGHGCSNSLTYGAP